MDSLVKADSVTNRKAFAVRLSLFGRHYIPEHTSEYFLLCSFNNKCVKASLTSYQRQSGLLKDYYNKVLITSVK
jgi:hypothetical protein